MLDIIQLRLDEIVAIPTPIDEEKVEALMQSIREKGLIRWFFQRKQGPGSHDPQSTSKPASKRLT